MADEVLFIDDEEFFARRYIENLRDHGFKVHYCERAEDAHGYIDQNPAISAIILDIMMPTPTNVSGSVTNNGLDTGLWLLGQLKDYVVSKPRPVLILTNRDPQAVEEGAKRLEFPDSLVSVTRKIETPAFYLPDRLGAFLMGARRDHGTEDRGRTAI